MNEAEAPKPELDYATALTLLKAEQRTARQRLAIFICGSVGSIIVMMLAACAPLSEFPALSYLLSVLLTVTGLVAFVRSPASLPADVLLRDTRLIGPLLDRLGGAFEERRINLRCWLSKLLPLMTERDADALTEEQRRLLLQELCDGEPNVGDPYRFIVLDALRNVADRNVLEKVRWLGVSGRMIDYSEAICAAAREIIPHLETLIEEREKRTGLLLPSSADEAGGAALLRASVPQAATTEAAQLLRADSSGHYDL